MLAVRQMGGVAGGVPAQTLEQKKKLLWGAKKAESVVLVSTPLCTSGIVCHSNLESSQKRLWNVGKKRADMCGCCGLQASEQGLASGVNRWDAAEFTSDGDKVKFQQLMVRRSPVSGCPASVGQ